ncbi:MAG: [FeFe] hydrogenase H-cluster radical SAM maturase HydG, partial [Planctomycetota bacterium]|nr:[FeFe] hydrogenase H-cluster radical SAM maturase HydG [Planctomycetota bacterium]
MCIRDSMGLLYHTIDLERRFDGIGPHTISFPRLEPALNAPLSTNSPYKVSDEDFLKALTVIRLSIPYTGMIITAREPAHIRREALMNHGCTQTDASSRIGIGAYSEQTEQQDAVRQQFLLSDTRSLDDVTREIASMGLLVSFCTAGYRCGRTGACFMSLAKSGKERLFCVLNALITFKEYLLDYASAQTRELGERLIKHHIEHSVPENLRAMIQKRLEETENGKRDIRF